MKTQELEAAQGQLTPQDEILSEGAELGQEGGVVGHLITIARNARFIGIVVACALLVGVVVSFLLPIWFTSTAKIMTPQEPQSSASLLMSQLMNSGAGSLLSASGSSLGLKNPNDKYIGLLNSRPIEDAIINKFGLIKVYRVSDMTKARQKLAANTRVVSEKSGFIAVSVTDRDRIRAAEIANSYIDQLRLATKTIAVTEASQRRLFYEDQLDDSREELVAAEAAFQKVQQNGMVELDAQSKTLITGLADLRARAAAKQVEVKVLRSYSTDNNPEVQLAENELSSIQGEIARMEHRSQGSDPEAFGLQDVAHSGLDYLRAQHELRYRQTLFDLLVRQYDAAKLDESKGAAVIQVVEPAIASERRSSPHRIAVILMFVALGIAGSCAYLIARASPGYLRTWADLKSAFRN
jgi:tyrosine-protein kinase Etk/Wzc